MPFILLVADLPNALMALGYEVLECALTIRLPCTHFIRALRMRRRINLKLVLSSSRVDLLKLQLVLPHLLSLFETISLFDHLGPSWWLWWLCWLCTSDRRLRVISF